MATTIFLAKNLTTLDLSEASFDLLSCVLNRLDRTNLITSVNLSIMKKTLLRRMQKVGNLVLCGANLSQEAIVQICHLISPTLIAINLAREHIRNEHVEAY